MPTLLTWTKLHGVNRMVSNMIFWNCDATCMYEHNLWCNTLLLESAVNVAKAQSHQPHTVQCATCLYVTNNVNQQTLNPDDDYVLPHQRLWTFDVLVCPLSASERFLLQPLICGTVFHQTSLLPPLSPSSAVVINHICSHFLIPLSDSSLICTVPAQWLVILDTLMAISRRLTFNIQLVWQIGNTIWRYRL